MQKEEIAAGVLAGLPDTQIAKNIGMSHTSVQRARKSDEVNALIEAGFKEISGSWSKAVKNIKHVVETFKDEIPDNLKGVKAKAAIQKKDQGFRASERLIESMGLLPSHSQPVYINNLMVQNNNQYYSPLTEKALSNALDVIDAEVVDPDE